ncbi:MAG: hypothetical protein AAB519_00265, partial [Patescibacteria group bacterium]
MNVQRKRSLFAPILLGIILVTGIFVSQVPRAQAYQMLCGIVMGWLVSGDPAYCGDSPAGTFECAQPGNMSPACFPSAWWWVEVPDACTADPSCAASTCTGSSCSDSCGNVYAGSQVCGPVCVANAGNSCSASNSCGMSGFGVIQCDGSCSAVAPSDTLCGPICVSYQGNACSAGNSCGMVNFGTYDCGGSCSAVAPSDTLCGPICVPYQGTVCSSGNSCGMTNLGVYACDGSCSAVAPSESLCVSPAPAPNLLINGSNGPLSIASGTSLNITWGAVADATTCSGTGTSWVGAKATTGGNDTISASGTSTYTITCTGPGGTGSDSVTVNVAGAPGSYTATTSVSVSCVPSVTCGTAPEGLNHCPADTY